MTRRRRALGRECACVLDMNTVCSIAQLTGEADLRGNACLAEGRAW